ncbi:flocculation protein FLO11-like [Cucumis melo var. makuwa]|uniref:Flocculation protein FLO11-like n=1 Tax=Cucumis melo var. makuwa TaxID=1194695 RepID=A0A5D3E1J8_CUCMM|nr:flocculation protein FLO11-like [Cucumis melo var. makuwa]TYK29400.1 flocculation protein FLO11-like [Cucumis melo var. makuwa]
MPFTMGLVSPIGSLVHMRVRSLLPWATSSILWALELRLLSGFLLSQQPTILASIDAVGIALRVISLSMHLFQGSHILDVSTEFDNVSDSSRARSFSNPTIGQPVVRTVLESVLCDLHRVASKSPTSPFDPQD